jgi:hypothetical protein
MPAHMHFKPVEGKRAATIPYGAAFLNQNGAVMGATEYDSLGT